MESEQNEKDNVVTLITNASKHNKSCPSSDEERAGKVLEFLQYEEVSPGAKYLIEKLLLIQQGEIKIPKTPIKKAEYDETGHIIPDTDEGKLTKEWEDKISALEETKLGFADLKRKETAQGFLDLTEQDKSPEEIINDIKEWAQAILDDTVYFNS